MRADGDDGDLVAARRARVREALRATDIDVLVLGRPSNVRYASGARQLWTSGVRPFSPLCVVADDIHLLSVWDDGVPAGITHDHLFGLSWNPDGLVASLTRIVDLTAARHIGTDGYSPLAADLLARVAPGAVLVDGAAPMAGARATKTGPELERLRRAARLASEALADVAATAAAGAAPAELLGALALRLAAAGQPIVASEDIVTFRRSGRGPGDPFVDGDVVGIEVAAMVDGYEGRVGRTVVVGAAIGGTSVTPAALAPGEENERCATGLAALVDACRPGTTGTQLCATWLAATGRPTFGLVAFGLGLGMEPPLVSATLGHDAALVEGATLCVRATLTDASGEPIASCCDTVLVAAGGGRLLRDEPAGGAPTPPPDPRI